MDEVPPPPSELPPGEEPLGVPVEPSDVAEDVANRPSGSAPAPASANMPTTSAGTDNRHTTKPTGEAATPNQPTTNTQAKDVKSGNDPNKPSGPAPDTDNRHTTKPTGDTPTPNQPDRNDGSKADPPAANNPGKQGNKGADGAKPGPNGKAPAGGNSKTPGAGGGNSKTPGAGGGNSKTPGAGGGNSKKSGGDPSGGRNGNSGAKDFPPLSSLDESMEPDFEPAGAPRLPSKCADDSDCRPCFDDATAAMDKQRVNLEKLRSIYDYTHKFTREGTEFLSAAGAAGGGPAQLGAAIEIRKVGGALDSFDEKVRNKSTELLGNLDGAVKQMAQCEAQYMDDDTWYSHYGQVYLQFMKGHYSF